MENTPLVNFHFQVEWGADRRIGFTEVTGLEMAYETLDYREGNDKLFSVQKIPGLRKFRNIVLKRGVYKGDNHFFEWFYAIRENNDKQAVTIKLLNEIHTPEMIWKVSGAWPVSIQYAALHATKPEILIERMELAHEGIEIVNQNSK